MSASNTKEFLSTDCKSALSMFFNTENEKRESDEELAMARICNPRRFINEMRNAHELNIN